MVELDDAVEHEGLEHLTRIEADLEEIKRRTPSPRHAIINGLFQGAGALVGGVVALVMLGWLLSLLGIIPGLGHIVEALQSATSHFQR
ncbi:MAG TPA: hypothetical protein VHC20_03615 [Candidatus Paceibacterota bacterium]|nr:hypothetical protein [Candidatus Paceibacterota bacterium]